MKSVSLRDGQMLDGEELVLVDSVNKEPKGG